MVSVQMLAEMSQGMRAPIQVNELALLASGGNRLVYRHPDEPRHLIKVFRTEYVRDHWGARIRFRKRWKRLRQYELFNREVQEYLSAHAGDPRTLAFTQKVVGFAETDLGLGLVVEGLFDREGALAPTLSRLVTEKRFDETARAALTEFSAALLESRVVISDLHWGNLVYAYSERRGNHFVMIDGLGSSNLIPLKRLFPKLNRRSKRARIQRLERKIAAFSSK